MSRHIWNAVPKTTPETTFQITGACLFLDENRIISTNGSYQIRRQLLVKYEPKYGGAQFSTKARIRRGVLRIWKSGETAGPSVDRPNCYDFGTPYEFIFNDLKQKDSPFPRHFSKKVDYVIATTIIPAFNEERDYTQNGLLNMLDRNRRIKEAPQKFQTEEREFDVILTLEERVYDQIVDHMHNRAQRSLLPVHIINIDIEDNHEEATIGAFLVCDLCEKLQKCADLDNEIDEVLMDFEAKNQRRNILHTIQFY